MHSSTKKHLSLFIIHILSVFTIHAATVSGNVTNEDTGDPIEGVKLIFRYGIYTGGGAMETEWTALGNDFTDANGDYSFEVDISADSTETYQIIVSHDEYDGVTFRMNVYADTVVDLTLTAMEFGVLTVTVADSDSNAIVGASVIANLLVNDGPIYTGTTDASGNITFEDIIAGDYAMSATAGGYITSSTNLTIDAGANEQNMYLDAGDTYTLTGTLTDGNTGIEGAQIVLKFGGKTDRTTIITFTESDGSYSLAGIPTDVAATYEAKIEIEAEGYAFEDYRVNVTEDNQTLDMEGTASSTLPYSSPVFQTYQPAFENLFITGNTIRFNIHNNYEMTATVNLYTLDGRKIIQSNVNKDGNVLQISSRTGAQILFLTLEKNNAVISAKKLIRR